MDSPEEHINIILSLLPFEIKYRKKVKIQSVTLYQSRIETKLCYPVVPKKKKKKKIGWGCVGAQGCFNVKRYNLHEIFYSFLKFFSFFKQFFKLSLKF